MAVTIIISVVLIHHLLLFSNGLTIKLIHRHSVDSPFYPGNLTRTERIKLLFHPPSGIRARSPTKCKTSIRPKMDSQGLMYMVQAGIGTFASASPPYISYYLHLDTGSDLTWTQCDECRKMGRAFCFRQKAPLFPARRSGSYRPLPCDKHALCIPGECIGPTCSYLLEYGDGATSLGYLAQESFTFASVKNKTETVKDTVFGCGIKNTGFKESANDNLVAGNFGLGPGDSSFLRQKMSITQGRFSYCLPPWDAAHKSTVFLRFGDDIPLRKDLKSTTLLITPGHSMYLVELKGISIDNTRLDIPQKFLARKNWYGGCIVDSGSSYTTLPPPVYGKLKEALIKNHLSRYKPVKRMSGFDICYSLPPKGGLNHLPSITFHFQGSDLVLPPRLGFLLMDKAGGNGYFCLAMDRGDINGINIIGAFQQANTRFVFDTVKRKMYFGPEDCTRGG